MKKETVKYLLIVAGIALASFVLYEIAKAIGAAVDEGKKIGDSIAGAITAPFAAVGKAADAIGDLVFGDDPSPYEQPGDVLGIGHTLTAPNAAESLRNPDPNGLQWDFSGQ